MIGARKVLEVVTNISILIVCGLICWTLATHKTFDLRTIFAAGGGARKPIWKASHSRLYMVTAGLITRRLSY
jgi:hypothetical protein